MASAENGRRPAHWPAAGDDPLTSPAYSQRPSYARPCNDGPPGYHGCHSGQFEFDRPADSFTGPAYLSGAAYSSPGPVGRPGRAGLGDGYDGYRPASPGDGYGGYPNGGYPNGGYPNGGYPNGGYPNGGYPNGGYPNGGGYGPARASRDGSRPAGYPAPPDGYGVTGPYHEDAPGYRSYGTDGR